MHHKSICQSLQMIACNMRDDSLLQCANCPQVFANARHDDSCFANHFSKNEIDARRLNYPAEDWQSFKSDINSAKSTIDLTPKNQSEYLSREKMSEESKHNFIAGASLSGYLLERESPGRLEEADRAISHKVLKGNLSLTEESVVLDSAITGASKDEHLKALLTDSASSFMSPQNQSMIATPENRFSPDRVNSLSPGSSCQNPANDFRSFNGHDRNFSNSSDLETMDAYQQNQNVINCNQTIISDCSNSDCDNNSEQFYDEIENGGNGPKRKSSSCDTIYPWMKESRQNQKKNPKPNVSSSEEIDKNFQGNKRERTAYTNSQLVELEKEFHYSHYLCRPRRIELANTLNLSERQIKIWFQNRRMKFKKEQKQKLFLPKNSELIHSSIAPHSGHQRHYPFAYFHQHQEQLPYQDESGDSFKYTGSNPREGINENHYSLHVNAVEEQGSMQSPAQRLQSFVTSSLPTLQSGGRPRHPIQNQILSGALTAGSDSNSSQMQQKEAYTTQQMATSPKNKVLHSHAAGSRSASRMNNSRADVTQKERMYDENQSNTNPGNRIVRNSERAYFSNHASYPDCSKNDSNREYYQTRSYPQSHDWCHSLPSGYHQTSHASALGNYVQMQQDAAELTLRHSVNRAQPRSFPATFLPFAYYGPSTDYDSQTSDSLHTDTDTPLDYSKTSYSKHGFNGYLGKSDLEKRPTNYFVSPGFARLTHL